MNDQKIPTAGPRLTIPLLIGLIGIGLILVPRFFADAPEPDSDLVIWLQEDVSAEQLDEVAGILSEVETIGELRYVSPEAAYEEFTNLFESDPELIAELDPDSLPASFRVKVPPSSEPELIQIDLLLIQGVRDVTIQRPPLSQAQLSQLLEDQALDEFGIRVEAIDLAFWFVAVGSLLVAAAGGAALSVLIIKRRTDPEPIDPQPPVEEPEG